MEWTSIEASSLEEKIVSVRQFKIKKIKEIKSIMTLGPSTSMKDHLIKGNSFSLEHKTMHFLKIGNHISSQLSAL